MYWSSNMLILVEARISVFEFLFMSLKTAKSIYFTTNEKFYCENVEF